MMRTRIIYGIVFLAILIPLFGLAYRNGGFIYKWAKTEVTTAVREETGSYGEKIFEFTLLGEDKEVVADLGFNKVPPRWACGIEGPCDAKIKFSDGTKNSICSDFGVKWGGKATLSGPQGEKVIVRCSPPPD